MPNQSSVSDFILLKLFDASDLQIFYFAIFLVIYIVALMGNHLITMAVVFDHHLHNPMHFFLMNLSILDVGTISVIIPKAMANSLLNVMTISYPGCATQLFFFIFLVGADLCILTVMAYDRYVAICKPLHYEMVMNRRACVQMASSAWVAGILNSVIHTWNMFAFNLCESNMVDLFFCEISQLLKLSCSDTYFREVCLMFFSFCFVLCCFIFIVSSYIKIFSAVLRIPSEQGRHKAFSTYFPHFIVVSLFVFSGMFAYFKPTSHSPSGLDFIAAAIYSVVPPMMNPIIYSMRNKEILGAMRKLVHCLFSTDHQVPILLQ